MTYLFERVQVWKTSSAQSMDDSLHIEDIFVSQHILSFATNFQSQSIDGVWTNWCFPALFAHLVLVLAKLSADAPTVSEWKHQINAMHASLFCFQAGDLFLLDSFVSESIGWYAKLLRWNRDGMMWSVVKSRSQNSACDGWTKASGICGCRTVQLPKLWTIDKVWLAALLKCSFFTRVSCGFV